MTRPGRVTVALEESRRRGPGRASGQSESAKWVVRILPILLFKFPDFVYFAFLFQIRGLLWQCLAEILKAQEICAFFAYSAGFFLVFFTYSFAQSFAYYYVNFAYSAYSRLVHLHTSAYIFPAYIHLHILMRILLHIVHFMHNICIFYCILTWFF